MQFSAHCSLLTPAASRLNGENHCCVLQGQKLRVTPASPLPTISIAVPHRSCFHSAGKQKGDGCQRL